MKLIKIIKSQTTKFDILYIYINKNNLFYIVIDIDFLYFFKIKSYNKILSL